MTGGLAKLGLALLELGVDADDLMAGMAKAKAAVSKDTAAMDKTAKTNVGGVETTFAGLTKQFSLTAMAMAGVYTAGQQLNQWAREAIALSAEAEENWNFFGEVFEENTGKMRTWAETANASLIQTTDQTGRQVAMLQLHLTNAGLSQQEAMQKAIDLVTRGADVASFRNKEMADVFLALESGINGETESLKRLGINVLDTQLKHAALRDGIISTGEEMTRAQKIQAFYNEVMRQTSKDAGDLERTINSYSNAIRVLNATVDMTLIKFGEQLTQNEAVGRTINKLAEAIGHLASEENLENTEQLITDLATIAEAILDINNAMEESGIAGFSRQLQGLVNPAEAVARTIRLLRIVIAAFKGDVEEVTQLFSEDRLTGHINGFLEKIGIEVPEVLKKTTEELETAGSATDALAIAADGAAAAQLELAAGSDAATTSLQAENSALSIQEQLLAASAERQAEYSEKLKELRSEATKFYDDLRARGVKFREEIEKDRAESAELLSEHYAELDELDRAHFDKLFGYQIKAAQEEEKLHRSRTDRMQERIENADKEIEAARELADIYLNATGGFKQYLETTVPGLKEYSKAVELAGQTTEEKLTAAWIKSKLHGRDALTVLRIAANEMQGAMETAGAAGESSFDRIAESAKRARKEIEATTASMPSQSITTQMSPDEMERMARDIMKRFGPAFNAGMAGGETGLLFMQARGNIQWAQQMLEEAQRQREATERLAEAVNGGRVNQSPQGSRNNPVYTQSVGPSTDLAFAQVGVP